VPISLTLFFNTKYDEEEIAKRRSFSQVGFTKKQEKIRWVSRKRRGGGRWGSVK
jgi:hypothetical protein